MVKFRNLGFMSGCLLPVLCARVSVTLFACVSLFLDPPIRGGSWLVSDLFLGFVSVSVFELSAVYVPIT